MSNLSLNQPTNQLIDRSINQSIINQPTTCLERTTCIQGWRDRDCYGRTPPGCFIRFGVDFVQNTDIIQTRARLSWVKCPSSPYFVTSLTLSQQSHCGSERQTVPGVLMLTFHSTVTVIRWDETAAGSFHHILYNFLTRLNKQWKNNMIWELSCWSKKKPVILHCWLNVSPLLETTFFYILGSQQGWSSLQKTGSLRHGETWWGKF